MSRDRFDWTAFLRSTLVSGTCASLLSAATMAACGRLEGGTAAGPNNGPSQWVWGRRAALERRASLKHTAVGYAIHHATSIGWATLHEALLRRRGAPSPAKTLATAALTSAVASFVDYRVAPPRLQPGFDRQLSRASMFLVYGAFAGGLALASKRAPLAAAHLLTGKLRHIADGALHQA